jgi:predicted small metal-binding protein
MKVLRCKEISPTYCLDEITGETIEEIIEKAKLHGRESHGLSDAHIPEVTIVLWRSRIRDLK